MSYSKEKSSWYNKEYYKNKIQKYTKKQQRLDLERISREKEAKKHLETIFVGGFEGCNEFCCANEGTIL